MSNGFCFVKGLLYTATPWFCCASHPAWRNNYGNKEEKHLKKEICEKILILKEVFIVV